VGFAPGDRVHIARLGTGVVRGERNGRYLVDIKGRTMILPANQLERAQVEQKGRREHSEVPESAASSPAAEVTARGAAASLDLHGKTIDEAMAALDIFLNDALLASLPEVAVIHGRSGGRIRSAVHARLRQLPPVRSFGLDPRNPGVTVVRF
jgi:DNA mismatch repair protein MutS2